VAERRLPYSVKDDRGALRHGELVIARTWRSDLEVNPDAEFTIVLLQQPPVGAVVLSTPGIVVCAPATPVRLPAAVREVAVAYGAGASPVPIHLPPGALESFAAGRLSAAQPLTVTAAQIFRGREPDIEALVRALDGALRAAQRQWEEADRVLSWPDEPSRAARPEPVRSRLRALLAQVAGALPPNTSQRLASVAGGAPPSHGLAEEIAFARYLLDDAKAAQQLAAMRSYLEGAAVDGARAELAADSALAREQLSFVTLLQEPHRFDSLRATFEMFRDAYARAYARHHAAYGQAVERLRASLDGAQGAAAALARLNTLRALGAPVGQQALDAYQQLRSLAPCAGNDLDASLREQPRCPQCTITLVDVAPAREAARTLGELHGALATQQTRLASEAVRRILARGGERIDQFLQIAQAADTAGLAQVLDDELLAFLRDLLAEPIMPTPEALDLFEQLARAYPVIDDAQVDAAVQTLRGLLTEAIARQAADPEQPGAFRLASQPPS
jgi:hypothetical protein